jgi:hypothetical protein
VVSEVMTKLALMTADPKTKKHSNSHALEQVCTFFWIEFSGIYLAEFTIQIFLTVVFF